jgi:hypothetical protein
MYCQGRSSENGLVSVGGERYGKWRSRKWAPDSTHIYLQSGGTPKGELERKTAPDMRHLRALLVTDRGISTQESFMGKTTSSGLGDESYRSFQNDPLSSIPVAQVERPNHLT